MKKNGSFINALQDKRISISLSHCNFLIAFHELTKDYPNIVHCVNTDNLILGSTSMPSYKYY